MTPLVLGVGEPYRGDDGVGLVVVARLKDALPAGVETHACPCEPTALIAAWRHRSAVIVIDAAAPNGRPGRVTRIDAPDQLATSRATSTHGMGLAEAWALADALGEQPDQMVVFAVEGADFGYQQGLSAGVRARVPDVAAAVRAEVQRFVVPRRS